MKKSKSMKMILFNLLVKASKIINLKNYLKIIIMVKISCHKNKQKHNKLNNLNFFNKYKKKIAKMI